MVLKEIRELEKKVIDAMKSGIASHDTSAVESLSNTLVNLRDIEIDLDVTPEGSTKK